MLLSRIVATCAVAVLAGCATPGDGQKPAVTSTVAKTPIAAAPLKLGAFADKRGEPLHWLGATRTGFGAPLKVLESDRPVAEMVQSAFLDGLRARGVTVDQSAGQNQITGTIKTLAGSKVVRREVNIEIEVAVSDQSGKQVFARTYSTNNIDAAVVSFSAGFVITTDDLRATLERTLQETVDKALDDSAFRAALRL